MMSHAEEYWPCRFYRLLYPNLASKMLSCSIADIGQFVVHHPRLTMRWR
jgi:hypothetical protein